MWHSSTLYRWIERFNKEGKEGAKDKSKRPHKLFGLKLTKEQEQLIFSIRKKYPYGQKHINAHLLRHHRNKLSTTYCQMYPTQTSCSTRKEDILLYKKKKI